MRTPHVLLVEDSAGDVLLTREALRDAEPAVELVTAPDGEAALALLREPGPAPWALVLCDLNLPRKDGREVLEEVRADPALRHLPIVVLTTSGAEADVRACHASGASAYVVKPRGLDAFTRAVRATVAFWVGVARTPAT